jgi:hypothetical protein
MDYRITGQHSEGASNGVLEDRIIKLRNSVAARK